MSVQQKMAELERRCPGTEFLRDSPEGTLRFYGQSQRGNRVCFAVDLRALGLSAEEWLDQQLALYPEPDPELDDGFGVICPVHGEVQIGFNNYMAQMRFPDERWRCPICGAAAYFDEDRFEAYAERIAREYEEGAP